MKILFLFLFLFLASNLFAQTYLVDQHFSSVAPTGWTSTSNVWSFTYNGSSTTNYRNVFDATKYSARFSSAANGNSIYLYVPINFVSDNSYTITFYTKRVCSVTINTNELPNQTTLLTTETQTNSNCNSNWNTWYQWSFTIPSTYTGSGYFQIWAKTIYGGPTSVYLDDLSIYESPPVGLPIELLSFAAEYKYEHDNIEVNWVTASEDNVMKYLIMCSENGKYFYKVDSLENIGSSSYTKYYIRYFEAPRDGTLVYVYLREIDYDGYLKDFDIVSVPMFKKKKTILGVYNLIGQPASITDPGSLIIIYTDGSRELLVN
jgi:hypothetical protein